MRRAERLFQLIQILRSTRQPVTARVVAEELEVSIRTVYRDVADLIGQRVPIRGEAGIGYVLDDGFDLPPLMLTTDEVEAAVLGAQWVAGRGDVALQRGARDLIAKLTAVMPPELRMVALESSVLSPPPHRQATDALDMLQLRQAIREHKKLAIKYGDEEGRMSERKIWPIAVVYYDAVRLPLPLVAGAVLSGAYFGDKMSPLSDTTNLAPAMVGTDLYTHIRHMMYTTGVTFALTLVIEVVIGLGYGADAGDLARIEQIMATLDQTFTISPILFIPPLLVLAVSFRRMPAIPGIAIGALAGAVFAVVLQGADYQQLVTAAFSGYAAETGLADVDSLLTRGGLESMFYTLSLIIVAMMFGGVMERTGQLRVVADRVLAMANSTGSLVLSTVLTAIGANLLLCDQYMAIVVSGRMYAEAYRERDLHPKNLSRAVEDSATVTANLVPWNSGGAYQAATLGVATLAYLPFNFFCWLSPIVTVLFAMFGITMHKRSREGQKPIPTGAPAATEAD